MQGLINASILLVIFSGRESYHTPGICWQSAHYALLTCEQREVIWAGKCCRHAGCTALTLLQGVNCRSMYAGM